MKFRLLATLVWWRITQNLKSPLVLLAIIASVILGAGHGLLDGKRFTERQAEFQNVRKSVIEELGRVRTYSQVIPYVLIKPEPDVLIAGGLENSTGLAARLWGVFGEASVYNPYTLDNPFLYFSISGGFGGSVISLYALFALALTFRAASTDRRIGAIRLLLSFGVSRSQYLAAEWSAALLTMAAPFVLGLATLLIASRTAGAYIHLASMPILALTILTMISTSAFSWLGLWISSQSNTARASLTISIVVWAIATWAWPSTAAEVGRLVKPVQENLYSRTTGQSRSDSLLVASLPTTPPVGTTGWSSIYLESRSSQNANSMVLSARQRNTLGSQYNIYSLLSCVSPIAAGKTGLASVCGSGGDGVLRFLQFCSLENEHVATWHRERLNQEPLRGLVDVYSDQPLVLNNIQAVREYLPTRDSWVRLLQSLIPLIMVNCILAFWATISFNCKSLVQAK